MIKSGKLIRSATLKTIEPRENPETVAINQEIKSLTLPPIMTKAKSQIKKELPKKYMK